MKGTIKAKKHEGPLTFKGSDGKDVTVERYALTIEEDSGIEFEGYTFSGKISDNEVGDEVEYERGEDKKGNTKFTAIKKEWSGGSRSNSAVDQYHAKAANDDRQNSIIRQSSLKVATDIIIHSASSAPDKDGMLKEIKELCKEIESFVKEV